MVRHLGGQGDPRGAEIRFEVSADEVDRPRADALVDQIGLADVDVDPIGVGVGADVDRRVLLEVREPPVELQVPRGPAVDLDDAGGGLLVAAHRWRVFLDDLLVRRRGVVRIPPIVDMRFRASPDEQPVLTRIVLHRTDREVSIGDDHHGSKRVRRAGYGRGMDTDSEATA